MRLNIFWIEDHPASLEFKYASEDSTLRVPQLYEEEYFTYFIFQHPFEVKEYLEMLHELQTNTSVKKDLLKKEPLAVPDLIVFDYKLSDHFSLRSPERGALRYNKEIQLGFIREKSISRQLKSSFEIFKNRILFHEREDVVTGQFSVEELKSALSTEDNLTNFDDEFGLFSGLVLLREFKNYITIGVPASLNKMEPEMMKPDSRYYEWLNEYDLKESLAKSDKGEKKWEALLKFGLPVLQKRIIKFAKEGRIRFGLKIISDLMKEIRNQDNGKKAIKFETEYGLKEINLDGLFVNIDDPKRRNESIINWLKELVSEVDLIEYSIAFEKSDELMKAFNSDAAQQRIHLSTLLKDLCNDVDLSKTEKEHLEKLKVYFGVGENEIKATIDNSHMAKSKINEKAIEYREIKTKNIQTNRLIVLFTDLRMHFAWQSFNKLNRNSLLSQGVLNVLLSRPNIYDLRTALYPIPKNPLILPYHQYLLIDDKYHRTDFFEAWEKPIGRDMNKKGEPQRAIFSRTEYPMNLTDFEIFTCKSFAFEIGLVYDCYPLWLKD